MLVNKNFIFMFPFLEELIMKPFLDISDTTLKTAPKFCMKNGFIAKV